MKRRVILSMADLMGQVEDLLTPYIGVAASVADHRHFVEAGLEHFCYGAPLPENGDMGYCLPTEVIGQIQQGVNRLIYQGIHQPLGMIWPARHYGFQIEGNDIVVEESTDPLVRTGATVAPVEDDDGYVPERLRRTR